MGNVPEKDPALDGVVDGIDDVTLLPNIHNNNHPGSQHNGWILTWSNGRVEDTIYNMSIADYRKLDNLLVMELKRLEAVKAQIIARRRLIKSVALGHINS